MIIILLIKCIFPQFICNNTEVAKKIAFHPQIRKRCVNLDGDIFDPNGTLTGGYVDPGQSILAKQEEYKTISQQIEDMRKDQRVLEEKIAKLRKDQDYLTNLKNDLESKTLKLNLLKEKMKQNSNAKMQDKHTALENDLLVFGEQIQQLSEMDQKYAKEIDELKQEKQSFVNSSNSKSKNMPEVWKGKAKKIESEIGKLHEEIAGLKKQIYKSEVDRDNTEAEVKKLELDLVNGENGYDELKNNYAEKKKQLTVIRKDFELLMVFIIFI